MSQLTATVEATVMRPFRCGACQFESLATVRTKGVAEGSSFLGLDDEGAGREASSKAQDEAETNAERLVALARCPECGECDEAARAQLERDASGERWLWAVVGVVGGLVVGALSRLGVMGALVFAVVGGVIGAVGRTPKSLWLAREVDERVTVVSAEALDAFDAELEKQAELEDAKARRIAELEQQLAQLRA